MRTNKLLLILLAISSVIFIYGISNFGGAVPGKTGAPNEGLCTDCHSDAKVVTDSFITFYPDWNNPTSPTSSYIPNLDARIEITPPQYFFSGRGVGFQITAYDNAGNHVGMFYPNNTVFTNSQYAGGDSNYVTHTQGALSKIVIKWKAPQQGTGNVNFYAAVLKPNGDGATTGDSVFKLTLNITENNTSNIYNIFNNHIKFWYHNNKIFVKSNIKIDNVTLYSIIGKKITSISPNSNNIHINTENLNKGVYILSFKVNNSTISRKIIIY